MSLKGALFVGVSALESGEVTFAIDRLGVAIARCPMNGSIASVFGRADEGDGELEAEGARKGGARFFPGGARRRREARRSTTP